MNNKTRRDQAFPKPARSALARQWAACRAMRRSTKLAGAAAGVVAALVAACTPVSPPPEESLDEPQPSGCGDWCEVDDASQVFAPDRVDVYELTVADADWDWLQSNVLEEAYVPAELRVGDDVIGKVGLRYKGSYGTLDSCVDGEGKLVCPKLSMKIKFSEYSPDKRYFGLKRLNFHAMIRDDAKMREHLAYEMFRDMGVYAPRAAHGELRVNGENLGLFAVVEQIDGRFTNAHIESAKDGNVYKERWPASTDPTSYDDGLKTNEDAPDHSGMIAFATALASADSTQLAETVAKFSDAGYLMRYLAVDRAVSNWDGIMAWYCGDWGCGNHNFYWVQEEERPFFWLVPWDLDSTFGVATPFDQVPAWTQTDLDCEERYPVFGGTMVRAPSCDPLIAGLAHVGAQPYRDAVAELLEGPLSGDRWRDRIDELEETVTAAVAADPTHPGVDAWYASVDGLRHNLELLQLRAEYVRDDIPIEPFRLHLDAVNDFEGVTPLDLALGTTSYSNAGTTVQPGLHAGDAMQGEAELRTTFDFRNIDDESMWSHWAITEMRLAEGEVDLLALGKTGLTVMMRADGGRDIRIDLLSDAHSDAESGYLYGWQVRLGEGAETFEFALDEAAFPDWGEAPDDKIEDVLRSVKGIRFFPFPDDRPQGLVPDEGEAGFYAADVLTFEG